MISMPVEFMVNPRSLIPVPPRFISTALLVGSVMAEMFRVPTGPELPRVTFGPIANPFIFNVPPVRASVVFEVPTVLTSMMFEGDVGGAPSDVEGSFGHGSAAGNRTNSETVRDVQNAGRIGAGAARECAADRAGAGAARARASCQIGDAETPALNEMLPPFVALDPPVAPAIPPTMTLPA